MTEETVYFIDQPGAPVRPRAIVINELRRLLTLRSRPAGRILPFGLPALDAYLPDGGLAGGALHEIVPETDAVLAGAWGFVAAILARLPPRHPLIFVMPSHGRRRHGRLSGHGLRALGLDPSRVILVETAHRKDTLWVLAEGLRSTSPLAIAGTIDRLDLKASQKLHLAAGDAGLPLFLLRPAATLDASAAATRWRIGTMAAARDRFGLFARPRWHLQLERCRNGRPGEWVVEYDHVAHRFSLAAALADPAISAGASDRSVRLANRA